MSGKSVLLVVVLFLSTTLLTWAQSVKEEEFVRLKAIPDNENKIDSLLHLAKDYWYQDPALCIEIARYAYNIGLQGNYRQKQADALNVIGAGFYFQEQLDSAIHYFNLSLDLSYALEYNEGIARVTNNLGLMNDYLGNYDRAIEFYYQSLEVEQEKNNTDGIASTYLNIGSIYVYLEEYDKALEFMTNSLRLYQQAKNEDGILRCFTNIGTIYSDIGIPENALTYSKKALDLSRKLNNPDLEAANLNNIGEIYYSTGDYENSIEYYNLALEIEGAYNDLWSKANTIRNIGSVYFEQKKYSQAQEKFNEALAIASEISSGILLKEIYFDLYKLYDLLEDYQKALNYHILFTNLNDSIFGENKRMEISKIESSNKMKYKDQQLQIIRNENEVKNLTIKTQRYALFISVILVLLAISILIILVNRTRHNKKAKNLLEGSNQVITKQKQILEGTVEQLEESEEKYKALTDSIQDGLIIIQDWKLLYMNDVMSSLLGYSDPEDLLSKEFDHFIADEDLEKVRQNYADRISGKDIPPNYTIRLIHKSGKTFEVSILVKLIQLQEKPAIIGTIKDISSKITYERALIRAKEKAEKATLSKSLFLAGMSHEIRNHLNGIIGIADVLGDTKLNKEQKEFVDVIKNSGDTLSSIINDILDLSKIEAGQVTLEIQELNLNQIIREVISLHELKAAKKGLSLKTEIESGIPEFLEGDPVRLSQILTNLVSNALKFTDEGNITIRINKLNEAENYVDLKFTVSDTGIGISEESQEKLFKPFSQTHTAIERNLQGSGLGLVICKHLVRLMKGKIGVDSGPGKGSDFWFTARFRILPSAPEKINGNHSKEAGNNRILIVEDNVLNQHLTTSILGKEGYEADIAINGKEGVALFMKKFYSVILMDIQMPVMDGLEATSIIRQFEAKNYGKKSTIIAITAHAKEGDQQKLMDAGLDFYLRKPFKPDALLNIIRNLSN